jgi:hypothetical protein
VRVESSAAKRQGLHTLRLSSHQSKATALIMRKLLLIFSLVFSLSLIVCSMPMLRIYVRTRMKGFLFRGLGIITSSVGLFGSAYWFIKTETLPWESLISLPFFILMLAGAVLLAAGDVFVFGKESGLWKEIWERSTFWEWVIGRVPILKHENLPPPIRSSKEGLMMALLIFVPIILIMIINILSVANFSKAALCSVAVIIFGILFFGFFVNRSKK